MVISTDNVGFVSQRDRLLRLMAGIEGVVNDAGQLSIDETLLQSAERCNVTPNQMKYALTFAWSEGLIGVDFQTAIVSRA